MGLWQRVPSVVPSWVWFALALVLGLTFVQINRYTVIDCDNNGECVVMDRLTGNLGHHLTRARIMELERDTALDLDGFLGAVAP